jgi:hypothetical protein
VALAALFYFKTISTFIYYLIKNRMIVLKDSTYTQNFKFMPRSCNITSMVFKDELANVEHEIENPVLVTEKYWMQFQEDLSFEFLIDGRTYNLTCFDGANVVYRDKIMCTNQSISTYTINQGVYVSHATSNEFIIYD